MTLPQDKPNRQRPFVAVGGDRPLPPELSGAVAAIGNFDGLHLGPRAVSERAEARAGRGAPPAVLLTFEPHPRAFFRPQEPVFRLTPLPLKLAIARRLGLDGAV